MNEITLFSEEHDIVNIYYASIAVEWRLDTFKGIIVSFDCVL